MAKWQGIRFFVLLVVLVASITCDVIVGNQSDADQFLDELNKDYINQAQLQKSSAWDFRKDINDETEKLKSDADGKFAKFQKQKGTQATPYVEEGLHNETIRELKLLELLGKVVPEGDDLEKVEKLVAHMESVYGKSDISEFDVIDFMAGNTSYSSLLQTWEDWRKKTGQLIRQNYIDLLAINNQTAKMNDFNDTGSMVNAHYLYDGYTEEQFKEDLTQLFEDVKPLYLELFTYVRRMLALNNYQDNINQYGTIPAHILGNMWAASWGNIADRVMPYNGTVRATDGMVKKGTTADEIFAISEKFLIRLGLDSMTETFKTKSIKVKPENASICQASAEDFYVEDDFRMRVCTKITHDDLITVHQKMSQIQYFMGYKELHWTFRRAANPGFYEAVGGAVGLSVATPSHLKELGFLEETGGTESPTKLFDDLPDLPDNVTPQDMNFLLSQALDKVAFIPFAFMVNQWRWSVYNGSTPNEELNSKWWEMRKQFQGLNAPVERNSETDFDAGSLYHIAADVEYVQYLVGSILQFQIYESLCNKSGYTDLDKSLYKCDFNKKADVGTAMRTLFEKGSSQPWPKVLEDLTGSRKMSADALLKYFQPLHDWLKLANANDCVGWEGPCSVPPVDNTVPIIVGVVLAVLVLLVIVAYFIGRTRSRKVVNTAASNEEGHKE